MGEVGSLKPYDRKVVWVFLVHVILGCFTRLSLEKPRGNALRNGAHSISQLNK